MHETPALWRPELLASAAIVVDAPDGFNPATIRTESLGRTAASLRQAGATHLVVDGDKGQFHIAIFTERPARSAFLLPIDDMCEERAAAALRLLRALRRPGPPELPISLRLSPLQRQRLTLLLTVWDRLAAGLTRRDLACTVIYPGLRFRSAAEWKASTERRRTHRLCDEAAALVAAGYIKLLKGKHRTRG